MSRVGVSPSSLQQETTSFSNTYRLRQLISVGDVNTHITAYSWYWRHNPLDVSTAPPPSLSLRGRSSACARWLALSVTSTPPVSRHTPSPATDSHTSHHILQTADFIISFYLSKIDWLVMHLTVFACKSFNKSCCKLFYTSILSTTYSLRNHI